MAHFCSYLIVHYSLLLSSQRATFKPQILPRYIIVRSQIENVSSRSFRAYVAAIAVLALN